MDNNLFDLTPQLTPEQYATDLHHRLKINKFPVPIYDVLRELKVFYREDDMGKSGGYDGFLVKKPGKNGILINKNIGYEPRKRFTIAHEIGHLSIKSHGKEIYRCTSFDIERYQTKSEDEYEANRFAAEFLLPTSEAKKKLRKREVSMALIKELSEEFGTSLTSTALKLVKLTEHDLCAVVLSEKGEVTWSCPSKGMSKRYTVKKGKLSVDTYACDFFKGISVPEGPQRVGPAGWLIGNIGGLYEVVEESLYFSKLGAVLTLITVPQDDFSGEVDEDDFI